MALAFLLFCYLAISGRLNTVETFVLVLGMFLAAISCVFILRPTTTSNSAATQVHQLDISSVALSDAIDCCDFPMYLVDSKYFVRHCNGRFLRFLGVKIEDVLGKHVTAMIDRFAMMVPPERREDYLEHQRKILAEGEGANLFSEIVDLSLRASRPERGSFRVWIHAEQIHVSTSTEPLGFFVRYHLVEVDRNTHKLIIEEPASGTQKTSDQRTAQMTTERV